MAANEEDKGSMHEQDWIPSASVLSLNNMEFKNDLVTTRLEEEEHEVLELLVSRLGGVEESSSADELFSYGILLPSERKKNKNKNFPPKQIDHQSVLPPLHKSLSTEAIQENASTTMKVSKPERIKEEADVEKQGHNHKSFWRFKSKSCGTGYGRSLCPLPILSRSFSSGSSTSPSTSSSVKKNMSVSKEGKNYYNNNTQKSHVSARSSSSSMGHSISYLKSPLKKSQASYGNDIPVILNVPSANPFGFGSIFSRSKDKTFNRLELQMRGFLVD
ncbi:hypothetical protein K1719_026870 [Acacia pycnantha]|nr:hypothetical protein K1719_026870 [Acacia pycnantha]